VIILLGTGLLLLIGLAGAWAVWHVVIRRDVGTHLVIYADGVNEPIATFRGKAYQLRDDRPLHAYPPLLIDAVLLMEDRRFHQHAGLDLRAVLRAGWANARSLRIVQGGSTLTQQLARSRYLNHERTLSRKVKEAILALTLEATHSKEEILTLYLNEVYLGQVGTLEVRGMAAASRAFLGKEPGALEPADVALLVGMIQSPNRTSPLVSQRRARERRDLVLRRLHAEGRLKVADYRRALREPIRVVKNSPVEVAHFLDFVRQEVESTVSPYRRAGGMKVFTTLDLTAQQAAHLAVARGLSNVEHRHRHRSEKVVEAALVALDVETGAIRAMVGGRSYLASQFNRAVQAQRQPGSLFKPFVYLAAFEVKQAHDGDALTPASLVEDSPLPPNAAARNWAPRNYNDRYHGKVRFREALERSLNAATVRVGEQVGLPRVIEQARASGIESPLRPGAATLLGASEVSLLEITAAYGTLARGGEWIRPTAIRRISDHRGRVLYEAKREARRAASPQAAFLVTSILEGTMQRGTAASARQLGLSRPAAGKTGTSNDLRDAWFVGYTRDFVAGVWVGDDFGGSVRRTGAQAALPVWTRFIEVASAGRPPRPFQPPPGIVTARIDPASGMRLSSGCPSFGGVEELFIEGTEPKESCPTLESPLLRWLARLFSP
jgi:penicillin-binding protein 1B